MTTAKKLQAEIEALASNRKYWREIANGINDPKSSLVVTGLRSRIKSNIASNLERLKQADPSDVVAVAKAQEAVDVCETILGEFSLDACLNNITTLDKKLHDKQSQLKRALDDKDSSQFGFKHLK